MMCMAYTVKTTNIDGVLELVNNKYNDERGFFFNIYRSSDSSMQDCLTNKTIRQINLSHNKAEGTLRGLHYQDEPHSEIKVVRCLKGRIWDVAVDLRKNSKTYLAWHAVEIDPISSNALVIPKGCAHGFQVLEPNSDVLYLHTGDYIPQCERGIRWNDPKLSISWPIKPINMSERDQQLPFVKEV